MIREPVVAGQFYPASAAQLKAAIKTYIAEEAEKEDVIGLVAPHAGYIYSGPVAGAVLSRVQIKGSVILIGPNHTGQGAPYSLMSSASWRTPLGKVEIDKELAEALLSCSDHLKEDSLAHAREHSLEVQLPFLQYFKPGVKIVPIILRSLDKKALQEIGVTIARVIKASGKEVLIFASSDMNHYESQQIARRKDRQAIEAVLDLDPDELIKRVEQQSITMCGYGPAAVMLYAVKTLGGGQAELVKYQTSGDITGDKSSVVGYAGIIVRRLSPLAALAKAAAETYVSERKIYQPSELTDEMREKSGVFVCIKKAGELRGCIGTFEPNYKNVAEEIVMNAVSSATRDPRFEAVTADELKDLEYSVDVLTQPVPVKSLKDLNAKKYGVIVQSGYRRGLLLPDLEGVDTPEQQIEICRQKGGIGPDEAVKLYRFEVKRYK